jgi:hypothetical protein
MRKHTIVAQFHDYGTAHRAFCELLQFGVLPNDISIIAGDRSNSHGANRDFGILEDDAGDYLAAVRRGMTLLAARIEAMEHARVADLIEQHAPVEIAEREADLATGATRGRSQPDATS